MRYLFFLFLFTLLMLNGCEKEYDFEFDNIHGKVLALGHGGMGLYHKYPINTFESVKNSISIGADGTEIDVQMTKDGVLFAFHDEMMDRRTNLTGKLHSKNYKEVELALYDKLPNGEFNIVTLSELFSHIPNITKYHFSFDCKLFPAVTDTANYYKEFAKSVTEIVTYFGLNENVFIESREPEFLLEIKQLDADLKLFYYATSFSDAMTVTNQYDFHGIVIDGDKVSQAQISELHGRNLLVSIFGVKTKRGNIEFIRKNPDMIQSDHLSSLVSLLK